MIIQLVEELNLILIQSHNFIDQIGHAQYISKFGLLKVYWQVQLTEGDLNICDTGWTISVHCNDKNVITIYQQKINNVISGVHGCSAYINDLVIYSENWEQHTEQLHDLLCQLQDV